MSSPSRSGVAESLPTGVTAARLAGLRRWNLALSVLHAGQGVAILLLASGFAITVNLFGADQIPGFVVAIYVSLLLAFFSFAVNQWLQYRGVGPWRDYAYGEKAYLVLSLVAKSLLAWQIFGGSLAP